MFKIRLTQSLNLHPVYAKLFEVVLYNYRYTNKPLKLQIKTRRLPSAPEYLPDFHLAVLAAVAARASVSTAIIASTPVAAVAAWAPVSAPVAAIATRSPVATAIPAASTT